MPDAITEHLLFHADNNLILSQRNAAWCAHGPVLEQDIAITNITLDTLGQARHFYQLAADRMNAADPSKGMTEDSLAYHRNEREFRNLLLVELPNGDWAQTITRQFFYSAWQYEIYTNMLQHSDADLVAIADKSLKETTYHLRWSSEWVIRLGDGTEESHDRMEKAIAYLWMYTGEMFMPAAFEATSPARMNDMKARWTSRVQQVFDEATLDVPGETYMQSGGKTGMHTEYLGYILAEMQHLQKTYPGATW
jgi:ring-1,2-phenylacetyl-CoA epoxidase subunit PaaC